MLAALKRHVFCLFQDVSLKAVHEYFRCVVVRIIRTYTPWQNSVAPRVAASDILK